ncbi:hypothetical protein AB6735_14515 [Mucilaginibacter sp. RCC_168]|uniref:hypothetical protein n=1 Tax=Mucilaginibacter sp. RCC_168 TaxID=3239221 RepID=UPI003525239E
MSVGDNKHFIFFGPKFSQSHFDSIFINNIPATAPDGGKKLVNHFTRSFDPSVKEVIFDLTLTEWVATEQINFLFAWMRNIKFSGRKLRVRLPFRHELSRIYSASELKKFEDRYATLQESLYKDSKRKIGRRKRSSDYLMTVYGLFSTLEFEQSIFEHLPEPGEFNKQYDKLKAQSHQIIPFTIFDTALDNQYIKFDTHFQDLIGNNLETSSKTSKIFELQNELAQMLRDSYCYSPFESKIISNIITQELYINSLQHSFDGTDKTFLREAYVTVFLSRQWGSKTDTPYFLNSYNDEKYKETLTFFKDKDSIREKVAKTLAARNNRPVLPRKVNLSSFDQNEDFKNSAYLEYSFIDFGQGIPNSLGEEFRKNFAGKKSKYLLSSSFASANEDSKIIEFALLLDSSKEPLDRNIEFYELIPRGLYFLIDMVRRYNGLLTVRSGKGIVICDFSDQLYIDNQLSKPIAELRPTINVSDAIIHVENKDDIEFPGTLFTIVIPEKENLSKLKSNNTSVAPVRMDIEILNDYAYQLGANPEEWVEHSAPNFISESFHYLSILFIYNEILEKLKIDENRHEIHVKDIYNKLLLEINKKFDELSGENCILFFDFAGLRSGNVSWIKILYYLMITPKVNELTKVIIFNLPDDEDKMVKDLIQNYIHVDIQGIKKRLHIPEPYIYKPIPCIEFNSDKDEGELIEWIGLKHPDDRPLLTSLLLGKKDSYPLSNFQSPENTEGTIFYRQAGQLLSAYSGLEKLKHEFYQQRQKNITQFLYQQVKNGVIAGKEEYVFLTSGGGFQFEYLSLYDVLHDKYMARYFAKCLLDDYLAKVNTILAEELKDGITDIDYTPFCFTKIIAVTISSQLVATSIYNILQEEAAFEVLLPKIKGKEALPTLIMLSSYYSFDVEKPFEKIDSKDYVMIVNDVISTGKLVNKMLHIIEKSKRATVNAIFSIADTRVPAGEKLKDSLRREITYEPKDDIEPAILFTLANFKSGLELRKFEGPYDGIAKLKRINPLLNSIVEFKESHTENNKILFPKVSGIIDDPKLHQNFFKIGHFGQNLTHVGYMTDLRPLFSTLEGYDLLQSMFEKLSDKYLELKNESHQEKLSYHANQIRFILKDLGNESDLSLLDDLIREQGETKTDTEKKALEYRPDYVFYPIFSGVEKLGPLKLSRIFKTYEDNIIGLQRFETPKGWRFPVPAKRLNHLTYKKKILILDTGSLTGDSIIQMIDTLCVLEVKEIVVLSIITRTEDFTRELFSRIKALKVKKLKGSPSVEHPLDHTSVPTDIFFGINLQISVYNSALSCPFCAELHALDAIAKDHTHRISPPHSVAEYLRMRKKELAILTTAKDELVNSRYLPVFKHNGEVDTKGIFKMRNEFGRIDTYRFYPDYFENFNQLQTEIIAENKDKTLPTFETESIKVRIEQVLICLLHEPHLIDLLNNFLIDLVSFLKKYLAGRIFSVKESLSDQLYYKWQPYALLQLGFLLIKDDVFKYTNFITILKWNDSNSKKLLLYQVWHAVYRLDFIDEERENIDFLLQTFLHGYEDTNADPLVFSNSNKEFYRIITRNYKLAELSDPTKLDVPFFNLSKFLLQGQGLEGHFFLKDKINEVIDAILEAPLSLERIKSKFHEVIKLFEDDLEPNLDEILADQNLKHYCKTVFTAISYENKGLDFYIKTLKELYYKIDPVTQEEISSIAEEVYQIKELLKVLIQQKLDFTTKDGFYDVFTQFPTNLTIELHDVSKRSDLKVNVLDKDKAKDVLINFNRRIFEIVLLEIIKNAKACYKKREREKPLEIGFEFERLPGKWVRLIITQNFPYIPPEKPENDGGLMNIVKHYVEAFGGSYTNNKDMVTGGSGADFQITLELKIHQNEQDKPDHSRAH